MMQSQKVLKPLKKTVVVTDYREREVAEHLRSLGAVVNMMNLEVGDFICSNRIVVERKDHSDYVSSIVDGRIFDQIERMKENFEKGIVVIEGSSDRKISENAYIASVAKLVIGNGVSIIHTRNSQETAKMIFWIAKKEQEEEGRDILFKVGKKPKETKEFQEMVVAGLPGVSSVIARRLLEHFGSVEKIFTANEEELVKVRGVGKVLAQRIRKLLVEKY